MTSTTNTEYDLVVIGGGPGGYVAAIRASQLGLKTALVERDQVGGICLNWGCIPTKALLRNAEVLSLFRRSEEFGIAVDGIRPDFAKAIVRSRAVVKRLTTGVRALLKKNGVEHVQGTARLTSPTTVEVSDNSRSLTARNVLLATGARPRPLPGLDVDGDSIITSRDALQLQQVPSNLVIVGGGATGVEFAYLFRAYGAQVTVVEALPRLVPTEDAEISQELERAFARQGIGIKTGSRITEVRKGPEGLSLTVESAEGSSTLECERVLVAVGVQGNADGLGLEGIGVEVSSGFVQTDDRMQTSVPGVYAVGDVTGKMLLAHVASSQGVLAVETIAGVESPALDYKNMPRAIYCHPQMTSFGYTEAEALAAGYPVKVGRFPFRANGRALALAESAGLVKVVAHRDTGQLLGAHMIGAEVTEMLPELTMTSLLNGTVGDLGWLVHSHPTLSEAVKEAALDADGKAIHT